MHYIYCYTNKQNQHTYVGQTNNLERRIREHHSCAFNEQAFSYNHLIHRKIRQYGEENFDIEVLEVLYTDDLDIVNERERYWVAKKESYCGTGKGYNMDAGGGQKVKSYVLSDKDLTDVKAAIKDGIPYIEIASKYGISASFISSINQGVYFHDSSETYPLCKYYKDNTDYDELIDLLLNSWYSYPQIAKMLGIGESTIKKINAGTLRKGLYPTYPIRKKSAYEQRADKVKELLKLGYSNKAIKDMIAVSDETIRRINIGESHYDEQLSYPIRRL